ncbi:hypothetical protein FJZ17_04370 [Candidatus Pacearchaeota archaeon]|nr:hypothetical protein [Candidatus Pacearchaeota archaeon]
MPRPRYQQPHNVDLLDPDLDQTNPALIHDRVLAAHLRQKKDATRRYKDDKRRKEELGLDN